VRSREFIAELRRTRGIGDITLMYDEPWQGDPPGKEYHLFQRHDERGVTVPEREAILSQIPSVYHAVTKLPRGQKFWIYDAQLDKAVGLRVKDRSAKIYEVNTVLDRRPWNSDDRPTFTVNSAPRKVAENTVSGSIAAVAMPLGDMISRQLSAKPAKYSNGAPVLTKRKKRSGRF
jgi:hypothetical protein